MVEVEDNSNLEAKRIWREEWAKYMREKGVLKDYLTDGQRHLICLPYSIENLHKMAKDLGIKRCWFHKDHYDIPKKRIAEIEAKCWKVHPKEIVNIIIQHREGQTRNKRSTTSRA